MWKYHMKICTGGQGAKQIVWLDSWVWFMRRIWKDDTTKESWLAHSHNRMKGIWSVSCKDFDSALTMDPVRTHLRTGTEVIRALYLTVDLMTRSYRIRLNVKGRLPNIRIGASQWKCWEWTLVTILSLPNPIKNYKQTECVCNSTVMPEQVPPSQQDLNPKPLLCLILEQPVCRAANGIKGKV